MEAGSGRPLRRPPSSDGGATGRRRLSVERQRGQIRDTEQEGFTAARRGLLRVEREKDGLEAGEGEGGAGGGDAREIYSGDKGDKGENEEAQVRVVGLVGLVEPPAEGVVAGAGGRACECSGDGGVSIAGEEKGASGAVGVGDGVKGGGGGGRREDGGEGSDTVTRPGDGLQP